MCPASGAVEAHLPVSPTEWQVRKTYVLPIVGSARARARSTASCPSARAGLAVSLSSFFWQVSQFKWGHSPSSILHFSFSRSARGCASDLRGAENVARQAASAVMAERRHHTTMCTKSLGLGDGMHCVCVAANALHSTASPALDPRRPCGTSQDVAQPSHGLQCRLLFPSLNTLTSNSVTHSCSSFASFPRHASVTGGLCARSSVQNLLSTLCWDSSPHQMPQGCATPLGELRCVVPDVFA